MKGKKRLNQAVQSAQRKRLDPTQNRACRFTRNNNHLPTSDEPRDKKKLQKISLQIIRSYLPQNGNGDGGGNGNGHNRPGPALKLTSAVQRLILDSIRMGNMRLKQACELAGITDMSFYNWRKAGREDAERIVKAIEEGEKKASEDGVLDLRDDRGVEEFESKMFLELKPNKFFDFFIEVRKAEAFAEHRNLQAIRQARDGGKYVVEKQETVDPATGEVKSTKEIHRYMRPEWTAAAWLLERKHPDRYGERNRLEVGGQIEHGGEVEHRHTIELPDGDERVAGILGILLASGAFVANARRIGSGCQIPTDDQAVIDAEAE